MTPSAASSLQAEQAPIPRAATDSLPQLEAFPLALQGALTQRLPTALKIVSLRVSKVRRSSSLRRNPHPISLLVDLDVRDEHSGQRRTERFYAKAFRGGLSAVAFAQVDLNTLVAPEHGAALTHLAEIDTLLWAWPNDPAMPQLATLVDPARLGAHLPDMLRPPAGALVQAEVLRYEPERRATLRCGLPAAAAPGLVRWVYGKTFQDEGTALQLQQRFDHFWQLARVDPLAPEVARPLGWDRATRTFWQDAAPGLPLMDLAKAHDALPEFERIGCALGKLHLAVLPTGAHRPTGHWLAELQRRVQKIGRALPGLLSRAERLGETLETSALQLPAAAQSLIHGDFHPEQVWLCGARVVFFDFDEIALGNPMEDLAEFMVKLEQQGASPERVRHQFDALLAGYRTVAARLFNPEWLRWHRAMQTLVQASRAFIYQEPGWPAQVESRLAASEALAADLIMKVPA